MGRKIQISFKELNTGDYFEIIDTDQASEFIRVDVVESNPLILEVVDTKDVPLDVRTQTAQERVLAAVQENSFVQSADFQDTILTIDIGNFGDLGLDIYPLTTDTSDFSIVSILETNGKRYDKNDNGPYLSTVFGDVVLDNLVVTDIYHQIKDFNGYAPRATNIAANFGNFVETEIHFTSAEALTSTDSVKFYHSYIENSINPYSQPDVYAIDVNLFKDPYHNSVTQFVVGAPSSGSATMNHVAPRWGQTGTASLEYTGVDNKYVLTYSHYIPFLPREDDYDLNNYVIPDQVDGGKSLKPIFKIDIISDKQSNAPEQSTDRVDLSNFFDKGSIGFYDQVFQTGEKLYTLENVVFNNGSANVDKIDSSRDTKITFDISADDAQNFGVDDEIIFHIIDVDLLTTEAAKRSDFLTNQKHDRAIAKTNNTPVNGQIGRISQFKAEINAINLDILNCEVTIPKLSVTSFYAIWVAVSRDGVISAQNLYLQSEVAESGGDETVINMDFFSTNSSRVDFNFFPHWQTVESNLSGTFNEVKAFPEDVYACKYRIVNEDSVGTLLQSFSTRIVNRLTGEIYEEFSLNNSDTLATYQRDWFLDQQFQNEVTIQWNKEFEAGKNEIIVNHAFKVPEEWQDVEGIVLEWSAFYNQTLDDGTEVSFNKIEQSPDFIVGIYDQTENTDLEPQALNNSGKVELFDYTGGVVGDSVSKIQEIEGAKTLVRYTFTDENLNDLQAIPSNPIDYTFNISERMDGNLTGYLGLVQGGGTVNEKYRFHNFENNYSSFWESVTGHVDQGFAKVQRTAIDTAIIEGVIDGTKFIETFNKQNKCYDFSARLDKVQTNPAIIDVDTDVFVIIDTSSFIGVDAAAEAEEKVNNWFLDYVRQTRNTPTPFVGNLVKVYPQMVGFNSGLACERWLCFVNACLNNREEVDMDGLPNIPVGYPSGGTDVRKLRYVPGLTTIMRAKDIDKNGVGTTVVNSQSQGIINDGGLQVYYSSFFDNSGAQLEHQEKIIDFYTTSSTRTLTFNGVSNRATVTSSTNVNVSRYNSGGANPSYDPNLLNFKGYYNLGGNTDVTQEYDGTPLTDTITFSGKSLFIPFIEDIYANSINANGYTFFDSSTINGINILERAAFNTSGADTYNETLPSWIYKEDYDFYVNSLLPNTNKTGVIVYAPQGFARTDNPLAIGVNGSTHLHILRALKGSSITLQDMQQSTFLRYYDDNGLTTGQNYNSLTSLNGAASGKLFDNTDSVGYNNLESNGVTTILEYGDYEDGNGLIKNITQGEFNSQITQGINNLS